jgi:hypothetical protein
MRDKVIKPVENRTVCGACHAHGVDPTFDATDFCTVCGRTKEQVRWEHGFVHLADKDLLEEGPGLGNDPAMKENRGGKKTGL